MTVEPVPVWPRDTTCVRVTAVHVTDGKRASLTGCAAALAIDEAIGPDVVTVSVDVDLITAHEKRAPFRWWHAEMPEEVAEWTAELDAGGRGSEVADAARLGLLDFHLTWAEGKAAAVHAACAGVPEVAPETSLRTVTFDLSDAVASFVLTTALEDFAARQRDQAAYEHGDEFRERWADLADRMRAQVEAAG